MAKSFVSTPSRPSGTLPLETKQITRKVCATAPIFLPSPEAKRNTRRVLGEA